MFYFHFPQLNLCVTFTKVMVPWPHLRKGRKMTENIFGGILWGKILMQLTSHKVRNLLAVPLDD